MLKRTTVIVCCFKLFFAHCLFGTMENDNRGQTQFDLVRKASPKRGLHEEQQELVTPIFRKEDDNYYMSTKQVEEEPASPVDKQKIEADQNSSLLKEDPVAMLALKYVPLVQMMPPFEHKEGFPVWLEKFEYLLTMQHVPKPVWTRVVLSRLNHHDVSTFLELCLLRQASHALNWHQCKSLLQACMDPDHLTLIQKWKNLTMVDSLESYLSDMSTLTKRLNFDENSEFVIKQFLYGLPVPLRQQMQQFQNLASISGRNVGRTFADTVDLAKTCYSHSQQSDLVPRSSYVAKIVPMSVTKGKDYDSCRFCGEKGHFIKNCDKYKQSREPHRMTARKQ